MTVMSLIVLMQHKRPGLSVNNNRDGGRRQRCELRQSFLDGFPLCSRLDRNTVRSWN